MFETIPDEPLISRRSAGLWLLAMLAAVALLCAGAVSLPHDPYIRFQQFASGDVARLRWVYERLHFDPTPIDVAVIGSSRIEASVSAPNLQRALSAELGRRIDVANLAVPEEGRDLHYAIAKELLRTHPETRLVLLSLVEPIKTTHPAYRNMAEVSDVLGAPMWINYNWLDNASFLPYRQLSLFVQSQFPALFGVTHRFDRTQYRGTGFDTTKSFRLPNGNLVDRDRERTLAELDQAAAVRPRSGGQSRLARLTGGDDNVIENRLTAQLARMMSARCTGLVLLHLPLWRGNPADVDLVTNLRAAPVLMTPAWIGDDYREFTDAGHLGTRGIAKVSRWLPSALRPYLGPLRRPPACPAAPQ